MKTLLCQLSEKVLPRRLVSKWIKNQGEQVKEDEPIVELETDKVNVEVPSPAEGVISKINFKTGDTVEVGALLGIISSQGEIKLYPVRKLYQLLNQ